MVSLYSRRLEQMTRNIFEYFAKEHLNIRCLFNIFIFFNEYMNSTMNSISKFSLKILHYNSGEGESKGIAVAKRKKIFFFFIKNSHEKRTNLKTV